MSALSHGHQDPAAERKPAAPNIQVSSFDNYYGMLVALTIMVGFFAALLFVIWLTAVISFKPAPQKTYPLQDLKGRGDHAEGYARDLEEPGVEELADVTEPQLTETLAAVTDAASSVQATNEAMHGDAAQMGTGKGQGDSRGRGPGGEGDLDVVPPWLRWEIMYTTASVEAYAKQLDFFKVELAAVDRSSIRVDYASNLSNAAPSTRIGTRKQEKRLNFVPLKSELLQFDRELLEKAKIKTDGKLIFQFCTPDIERQLTDLEIRSVGGNRAKVANIRRTQFGVKQNGNRYDFYVIRQIMIR